MADDSILVPDMAAPANADTIGWDSEFARERFLMRARALFFARVALLTMGLGILLVPPWKAIFQVDSILPIALYMGMVAYSAANYVLLDRPRIGEIVTFVTLCQDLTALVYLIAVSGGMHSPLLPTQLLFTMMFVMLFPRPWAVVPPLLTFPVVAYVQQERELGSFGAGDLFLLLWYCVINCIVLSLVLYLHTREEMKHREILRLQASLGEMAVIEERTRLAREIHDGLGGTLSSLILQVEYIQGMAHEENLRRELSELKAQAEESIDELRRALTLMRDDFDLVRGVEDACLKFETRNKGLKVDFVRLGRERHINSEAALTLFRVLQESLTNVARHAKATRATVSLRFEADGCTLSVADNGKGFDEKAPPPVGHYGLLNMVERAQRVHGLARIESTIGRGTIVSLTVPNAVVVGVSSPGPLRAA